MIERIRKTPEPCGNGHSVLLVETRGSRLGEPLGNGKPRWHCECPPCGLRGKSCPTADEALAPYRVEPIPIPRAARPFLTLRRTGS